MSDMEMLFQLQEENRRLRAELDRAFSALELCGVPKERAKSVSNGIQVFMTRTDRERQDHTAEFAAAKRDAERYRHMRASAVFQDRNGPGLYWYLPRWDRDLPLCERLDAAIDAAMKEAGHD